MKYKVLLNTFYYNRKKLKTIFLNRIDSLKHAFHGIKIAFQETNLKVEIALFSVLSIAGAVYGMDKRFWVNLVILASIVLSLEIVNTAFELLCDFIHPTHHQTIKKIKDLAAAAVLVGATAAFITVLIIIL